MGERERANYELVRGEVLRMLDGREAEEANDLRFMLDASASIVEHNIVGSSADELRRVAAEMLARGHRVTLD